MPHQLIRAHNLRALVVVALALLTGCGGEADRTSGEKARREGGWSFAWEQVADLETAGSEPLVQVSGAVRLRDRIVVADMGSHRLAFYDLEGRFQRSAGRQGRGPGEFQYLTWVGALGPDSVIAWDAGLKRFTVLSADGRAARSMAPVGAMGFFPTIYGVFVDGTLLMSSGMGAGAGRDGPWRDTTTFLRVGRNGEVLDSLGRFPGPEQVRGSGAAGASRTYARPFGRETFAAVHGNAYTVSTGDRYELVTHEADGRVRRILRRDVPAVRLTRREIAGYRAELLAAVGAADAPAWRRLLDETPFPDALPPVMGLIAGPDGELWAREAQPPSTLGEGATWSVFGRDGRWLGSTRAPPGFAIHQVGPDWVLGRYTDPDQGDHVRLYRLRRNTTSRDRD